jgi:hypothetical protein
VDSENRRTQVGCRYADSSESPAGEGSTSFVDSFKCKASTEKVREEFLIIYELEGCQKAVNYLTKYYQVRRMKIILDGKRVRKEWFAWYEENQACFKKEGLTKRIVLHELYHHLIEVRNLKMPLRTEEKEATSYARRFFNN